MSRKEEAERRIAAELRRARFDRQPASHEEGVASSCASTTARFDGGGCRRAWLTTPRVERGRKRGGKLALIEAGDSSHAHPGGSCKRSTAVKEKETKRAKEEK